MDYYLLLDWRACICMYYNRASWGQASNFCWLMHKHKNSTSPSEIPSEFSHSARLPNRPYNEYSYRLRVEGHSTLAGLQMAKICTWLLHTGFPHWTRLPSRSQFEGSRPQDYCINTYVIQLAWLGLICLLRFALTSDSNVFRCTSILNYIIVRHWYCWPLLILIWPLLLSCGTTDLHSFTHFVCIFLWSCCVCSASSLHTTSNLFCNSLIVDMSGHDELQQWSQRDQANVAVKEAAAQQEK